MKQRKLKIAILRRSLDLLYTKEVNSATRLEAIYEDELVPNVCWAIDNAQEALEKEILFDRVKNLHKLKKAKNALMRRIEESLDRHIYVSGWLASRGYPMEEYSDKHWNKLHNVDVRLVEYRRAWVKDMIRTLENGGKL